MRRFLICSGIDGERCGLELLRNLVEMRHPEGVLFAGGVLGPARKFAAKETLWDMTRDDAFFLEEFFETLGRLNVFSAIIPGCTDSPLEQFLRLGMHAEIERPTLHLVHATLVTQRDVAICGMGGCPCEESGCRNELTARTLTEYGVRSLWAANQPRKVLLLAKPPIGPLGGDEGSLLTNELIDSGHPSLTVVAGSSERRGVERVARTLVVNPGRLAEGSAAYLDWDRASAGRVEFLSSDDAELMLARTGQSESGE